LHSTTGSSNGIDFLLSIRSTSFETAVACSFRLLLALVSLLLPICSKTQSNLAEEMKICETFIIGMLKTNGSASVEKLQGILTNYVPGYSWPIKKLNEFLNKLAKEEKLEQVANGNYTLRQSQKK